jgi:hypothetical protein
MEWPRIICWIPLLLLKLGNHLQTPEFMQQHDYRDQGALPQTVVPMARVVNMMSKQAVARSPGSDALSQLPVKTRYGWDMIEWEDWEALGGTTLGRQDHAQLTLCNDTSQRLSLS